MKTRIAFLFLAGLLAILLSGELYTSMRENAADEDVRKVNSIPEGEDWQLSGRFSDPPSSRLASQGPVGNPRTFFEPDRELGYRLRPNLRAQPGRLRRGGTTFYDVTYSTGRFGWRTTPQVPNAAANILFFGDDYTFGQGVSDAETLPARFSAAFKGQVLAHNFGVPGWGAQQVLRLLELEGEKPEVMQSRVTKVFYFLAKAQLARLGGELPESAASPRYEIHGGKAVFNGYFPDPAWPRACAFSSLCDWARSFFPKKPAPENRALPEELVAVLARVKDIVKQRYGCGFTVLSWNPGDAAMDDLERQLRSSGIDVVSARTALPDLGVKSGEYVGEVDGRPNARAFALLGAYLAERLRR